MSQNPNTTHYTAFLPNQNKLKFSSNRLNISPGATDRLKKTKIPGLLKRYPDLFSDQMEKSKKAGFWKATEKKLEELFLEPSLTQQQKNGVLKKFIYKVLKEKHLLSEFFGKERLKKIKKKVLRVGG